MRFDREADGAMMRAVGDVGGLVVVAVFMMVQNEGVELFWVKQYQADINSSRESSLTGISQSHQATVSKPQRARM